MVNMTLSTAPDSPRADGRSSPLGAAQRDFQLLRRSVQAILGVALLGAVFSGLLTFREYINPAAEACAPLGDPGSIFGQPSCVYGLVMFGLITLFAGYALLRTRSPDPS